MFWIVWNSLMVWGYVCCIIFWSGLIVHLKGFSGRVSVDELLDLLESDEVEVERSFAISLLGSAVDVSVAGIVSAGKSM